MESVYWVFTHNCNLRCAHCYNWSRPGAPTISRAQADAVLGHLPEDVNRFILSGGEPLVELDLLLYLLEAGRARYPAARISIQTPTRTTTVCLMAGSTATTRTPG